MGIAELPLSSSASPLLIAAYTDELDCVAVFLFPDEFRATYGLARGSRLLTVNTYEQGGGRTMRDLILGPNWIERWVGFPRPIVAEFVSDDLSRIEARKAQNRSGGMVACRLLGRQAYLRAKPGFARDGRPVYASLPAAKRYN